MTGLDGQNGSSGSEVSYVGNVLGGAEVGRVANTLEESRGGDEALGVSDTKVVSAGSDSLVTESLGEEVDVSLLVAADLDESLSDPVGVAGSAESGSIVGLEGLAVEGGLEVLKGKSVVEDDSVNVSLARSGTLLEGSGDSGSGGGGGKDGVLGKHFE